MSLSSSGGAVQRVQRARRRVVANCPVQVGLPPQAVRQKMMVEAPDLNADIIEDPEAFVD